MKIKETTREDMTAEGRKQKRREETGRLGRISAPQRAAGATNRRLLKASGKGDYRWISAFTTGWLWILLLNIICQNVEDET
jgi:hypothetical protein